LTGRRGSPLQMLYSKGCPADHGLASDFLRSILKVLNAALRSLRSSVECPLPP
jgi:hypothetical protein